MINSWECVADFDVDRFSILSRSHSRFHLKVLKTLYVRSLQPSLCKQRDCLLGLNVISLYPSAHCYYYYLSWWVFFGGEVLPFSLFLYFFSIYISTFKYFPGVKIFDKTKTKPVVQKNFFFNNKHAHTFLRPTCFPGNQNIICLVRQLV